jgi:putative NADPH-quinone reductase
MNAVLRRVVVIQGHPDPARKHFCHALADAYADGARESGHEVRRIEIAQLDFPLLRTKEDFEGGTTPPSLRSCQADLGWADHLVLIYPLWLGSMPALLKAFLEQVFRPGFAFEGEAAAGRWRKRLRGKSARIVVTMGMPTLVYRWYFRAHSLKSLERNILGFCGIGPIRETLIGMVETIGQRRRSAHLSKIRDLGRQGR